MRKQLKHHWKRAVSGLMALVMAAGLLPISGLAAEVPEPAAKTQAEATYAPTGNFELNVAGTTAWVGGEEPMIVYSSQIGTIQAAEISTGEAFALLEYGGGDRLKIGYCEGGWTGGSLERTGWVDKDSILVNLPDLIPSIAYIREDAEPQFNSRLTRHEFVVPCPYQEAERLAQLQAEAMDNSETLVLRMEGQTVTVSRAAGDPASLETYSLDGVSYQKYAQWTEVSPADSGISAYQLSNTVSAAYSADPSITLGKFAPQPPKPNRAPAANSSPTGGVGAYNPGSPGGQRPHTSNVAWAIDPERTFLRFTLIEFPQGVTTDLNTQDWNTWHVVGTPLNVVWSNGWSAEQCRSDITWYNSCALQYNALGANAPSLMAGSSVNQGVYSYDATVGYNRRWVTTADEFQAESGITNEQKEQMFHLNSSAWSTGWLNGDYTSMWGTNAQSVTPGNLYQVYQANDAFLYLLGRLTETDNGSGGTNPGWSKDEALEKWSEYVTDGDGNLRTKYRILVETGMVLRDPDGGRRGFTLRDMMAYSLYNNEASQQYNLIWDQSSTTVNMAQWMRQAKQQFLEYPLDETGTPTGEELTSTNGFAECDSYVDTIQYARPIRDTIFSERRSFGLHIFSPFNFEHEPPDEPDEPDEPDTPDPGEPDEPDEPDTPTTPAPGKTILFKRDANTNEGVGPATFQFSSVTNGDYEFDTDENGVLETIQWWDPTESEGKYIKPGEYTVTELIPPPNYLPSDEVQQIKLELDENGDPIPAGPLVFQNLEKVGLRVVKYDRESHTPMSGVTFEIFRDGTSIGRYETDGSGEILLTGIEPGTYRAVEVDTGDGSHILDSSYQEVELAAGGGIKPLVFFNDTKPGLKLVKVDSTDMDKAIPGAVFEIKAVDGSYGPQQFVTDANGEIDLSGLPTGSYVVTELACDGYVIDDAQRIIHLRANDTAEFVFTNTPKPGLKLVKVSADSTPMEGVTFRIARIEDGSRYLDRTTDENGEILVTDLEPGVYSVQEISTLPDHILDPTEYHVELSPGKTAELRLTNDKRPSLTIHKSDADTEEPVEGAVFLVKAADGSTVTEVTTGSDGTVTIENLLPIVYEVIEKSVPDTYLLDAPSQIIALQPNWDSDVYFENHKAPELTIYKKDSVAGAPVEGARFHVTYTSNGEAEGAPESFDFGEILTDANGEIKLHELGHRLYPGEYTITEVEPAPGFQMKEPTTQTIVLHGGETRTVTFENVPLNAIIVEKYDSVTGEALAGATFQLRYLGGTSGTGGTIIGQKVTGTNGTAVWTGLESGTYILEEVDPADGYSIIQSSETVYLAASGEQSVITVRFENMPDGILLIRKVCATNPSVTLPDAEFKITYADGTLIGDSNGIFRTDENGEIRIEGLAPGKSVIATEVAAPPGYIMDTQSQTIQIQEGRTVSLTFKNQPKGELIIQKRDSATKQPLPGAEFRVTTAAGCEVGLDGVIGDSTLTSNGIFTTDSNGEIRITNLAPGAYVLTEIKAPQGYTIDTPSTNVVIGEGGDTQTVVITNTPKGGLLIKKMDSVTKEPLSDVTFKVTTADGAVVGTSNGEYRTDSSGCISIPGLEAGTYIVQEVQAKSGYLLDDTPKTITVKDHQTYTLEVFNQPKGGLIINKLDSVTHEPLEGVEFTITEADGTVVDDNGGMTSSMGLYRTDENGQIILDGLVGTFIITETKTIEGYTIHEETRTQTVVVNPNDTQTITVYNDPIGGVELVKVNSADHTERIPNTTFEVREMDGGLVDTVTTDRNGRVFLPLEDGAYYAVEIESAEGFKLDDTPAYFTVENGKTTTLQVENEAVSGILIHKTSSTTGEGIYGVTFLLYDDTNTPIDQQTTDDRGYAWFENLPAGRYYLWELENEGYVLDTEKKTVYVKSGETTLVEWENTPITGQIQVTKTSADYNSMNGWPAGTPIPNTEFEIYNARTGNLVDTIKTDKNGVAASRPLPLGRYRIVESKAADFYSLDKTPVEVEIEFEGQIVKAAMTNKSLYTNVSIQKTGYVEVMPGQAIRYDFANIANNSTASLTSFFWRDTLPTQAVRLDKIVTGTYNVPGNYKVVYQTNLSNGAWRTLADNLSTQQNYVLDASPAALGLAANECVTQFMVSFGVVPSNFRQVEVPQVTCTVLSGLTGGAKFTNTADVGGVYDGQWIMAVSRWVTTVYKPSEPLPRTGY